MLQRLFIAARWKGPLWEGAPAKRVGERVCDLTVTKGFVSPSVSFADSSLTEGAFTRDARQRFPLFTNLLQFTLLTFCIIVLQY